MFCQKLPTSSSNTYSRTLQTPTLPSHFFKMAEYPGRHTMYQVHIPPPPVHQIPPPPPPQVHQIPQPPHPNPNGSSFQQAPVVLPHQGPVVQQHLAPVNQQHQAIVTSNPPRASTRSEEDPRHKAALTLQDDGEGMQSIVEIFHSNARLPIDQYQKNTINTALQADLSALRDRIADVKLHVHLFASDEEKLLSSIKNLENKILNVDLSIAEWFSEHDDLDLAQLSKKDLLACASCITNAVLRLRLSIRHAVSTSTKNARKVPMESDDDMVNHSIANQFCSIVKCIDLLHLSTEKSDHKFLKNEANRVIAALSLLSDGLVPMPFFGEDGTRSGFLVQRILQQMGAVQLCIEELDELQRLEDQSLSKADQKEPVFQLLAHDTASLIQAIEKLRVAFEKAYPEDEQEPSSTSFIESVINFKLLENIINTINDSTRIFGSAGLKHRSSVDPSESLHADMQRFDGHVKNLKSALGNSGLPSTILLQSLEVVQEAYDTYQQIKSTLPSTQHGNTERRNSAIEKLHPLFEKMGAHLKRLSEFFAPILEEEKARQGSQSTIRSRRSFGNHGGQKRAGSDQDARKQKKSKSGNDANVDDEAEL